MRLLKRVAMMAPVMWLLITLCFFLMRLAPGGPFDQERPLSPEVQAALAQKYHLDESLPRQYWRYLSGVVRGDFGPSYQYPDFSVGELIADGLPVSLTLGMLALTLALALGVSLGVLSALHWNRPLDHALMACAAACLSLPNYVLAPLLILFFAVHRDLFPAGGWGDGQWAHLLLPVLALSLRYVAEIARVLRGSLLEVLGSDFIRTARAKGLSRAQVLWRHALRPALVPLINHLGPAAAAIVTGSVVIEKIFSLPGLGRYFVQGALNRDYTLVLGVVIVVGVLTLLFNLLADLLSIWANPRTRENEHGAGR